MYNINMDNAAMRKQLIEFEVDFKEFLEISDAQFNTEQDVSIIVEVLKDMDMLNYYKNDIKRNYPEQVQFIDFGKDKNLLDKIKTAEFNPVNKNSSEIKDEDNFEIQPVAPTIDDISDLPPPPAYKPPEKNNEKRGCPCVIL